MADEQSRRATPLFPKPPSARTLTYAFIAFALSPALFAALQNPLPAIVLALTCALALLHGALTHRAYENTNTKSANTHTGQTTYTSLCDSAAHKTLRAQTIFEQENRTPNPTHENPAPPSETGLLALRTARSAAGIAAQRGRGWKATAVFGLIAAVYILILRLPVRPYLIALLLASAFTASAVLFETIRGSLERAEERTLLQSIPSLAGDNLKELRNKLEKLSESRFDRIAAPSHTALSCIAEREGDFELALAHINLATIHHLRARFLGRNRLPLPHEMLAQRAFLLALLKNPDEARAEIAWLHRTNAPSTDETRIRAEALLALQAGEYDRASELFDQFDPQTLLSAQDEALLLMAYRSPRLETLPADERAWLRQALPGAAPETP